VLTNRLRPTVALLLLPLPALGTVVANVALGDSPPAVQSHLDEPPPGVDIHRPLSIDDLRKKVRLDRYPGRPDATRRLVEDRRAQTTVSNDDEQVTVPGEELVDGAGELLLEVADGPVPSGDPGLPGLKAHVRPSCTGTGTDGNRVQVIYAVEKGKTNRYNDLLPLLRSWVADVDDTFALSSQKTGGGLRVRWVHNKCVPVIPAEVLPAGALTNGFSATVKELKARGYTSKTRKYLVFADDARMCGVGHMYNDSSKTGNYNDGRVAMFSRVDSGCWSFPDYWHSTAAHELMHNIGGVQNDAPSSTKAGHCNDEQEAMCYDDGGSAANIKQVCKHEGLFDCRNDDYFHTAPPAGSYLATRWNPADSSFLDKVGTTSSGSVSGTPIIGDWDGDGVETAGKFVAGSWTLRNANSSTGSYTKFSYGRSGDVPVVGDWNGDGKTDIGVFRKGMWYLRMSATGGSAQSMFGYGRSTDVPLTGDWDGNRKDTPGVRRGNVSYLKNGLAGGGADLSFGYGKSTDLPVVGNWDADAADEPGVVRGSTWYLRNTLSTGTANAQFTL
jgi:hypothetical protein